MKEELKEKNPNREDKCLNRPNSEGISPTK